MSLRIASMVLVLTTLWYSEYHR